MQLHSPVVFFEFLFAACAATTVNRSNLKAYMCFLHNSLPAKLSSNPVIPFCNISA